MNRTSSKSRSLKIQREVVRVLTEEQLTNVGGGDLPVNSKAPVYSVCDFLCRPTTGTIIRTPDWSDIIRDPVLRDPVLQSRPFCQP
jgi:ABC-type sulfate transport system substrate-binding protein